MKNSQMSKNKSASQASRVVKVLTLKEKYEIILKKEANNAISERSLAKDYGCSKTQINTTLKRKKEIKEEFETHLNSNRKQVRFNEKNPEVNLKTYEWLEKALSRKIPISGPILQKVAVMFARELGNQEFVASNGWLSAFRKRYNVGYHVLSGESASVNVATVDEWKSNLTELCKDYSEHDIYNLDETGLFWRALPRKSLTISDIHCFGGKQSKERITIMFCCNMSGSHKLPLLVIGKSREPRAFKNWKLESQPMKYYYNTKAWMKSDVFEDWIVSLNDKFRRQNRNILMVLDNASCHPNLVLSNIKLAFLPPNTTSLSQPLDQGIIKTFKGSYRSKVVLHMIAHAKDLEKFEDINEYEFNTFMNIRDAMYWADKSWKDIEDITIRKCFMKAGFPHKGDIPEENESVVEHNYFTADPDKYISFDDDMATHEVADENFEELMIDAIRNPPAVLNEISSDESDDDIGTMDERRITSVEALKCITDLKMFASQHSLDDVYEKIDSVGSVLIHHLVESAHKTKQSVITDFFSRKTN